MRLKLLLITMLLWSNIARAEFFRPSEMTVSEFYSLDNRVGHLSEVGWSNYTGMNGYLLGIRGFNAGKYWIHGDKEAADCINKPINVWNSLVFDKYKLNKIKGDDLFFLHFIKTIDEVCNVDLWGLKEN